MDACDRFGYAAGKNKASSRQAPMQYSAHAPFVAPARMRPQLWRLLVGLLLTAFALYALVTAAIFGLVVVWSGIDGAQSWLEELSGSAGPPARSCCWRPSWAWRWVRCWPCHLLHRRSVQSLFGPLSVDPVAPFPHDAGDLCRGLRHHGADPDTQR
jgi:hypothetical protein